MPVDTFMVPQNQEQQPTTSAQQEAYFQAGIDQLEAMANDPRKHSTAREIEDAILTPEQRAAQEALWVLGDEEAFDPNKFDEMNREVNSIDGYYTHAREAVAPVQEVYTQTFTPEMARLDIEQGTYLQRVRTVAQRLQYERKNKIES